MSQNFDYMGKKNPYRYAQQLVFKRNIILQIDWKLASFVPTLDNLTGLLFSCRAATYVHVI